MMNKLTLSIRAILYVALATTSSQLLAQSQLVIEVDYDEAISLNPDVYGCNNLMIFNPYQLTHPGFIQKYNELGKPVLRYPGGTPANFLNLLTGFHQTWPAALERDEKRAESFNDGLKRKGKGKKGEEIEKFLEFLDITEGKSTFVMNLTVMTSDEIATMLDQIVESGQELDYVEMGNELYFGTYKTAIPDGSTYISLAKERAKLVRARFPNAKIGIMVPSQIYTKESFLPGVDNSQNRQEKWYEALKREEFYDGLVIHLYSTIGMNHKVKAADFLPYQAAYHHTIAHADKKFEATFAKLNQDFPGKEIWVTEYHVGGFSGDVRKYRLRHSYLGGLYAGNFLL